MTLHQASWPHRNSDIDPTDLPDRDYPYAHIIDRQPLFSRREKLNLTSAGLFALAVISACVELGLPAIVNFLVVTLACAPMAVAVAYLLVNGARGRIE